MARPIIITCAVTGGSAQAAHASPYVPVTPEAIANECLAAAEAGAAVVHIHARNVETKSSTLDPGTFREIVERIRARNTDVIINLTGGTGAFYTPSEEDPRRAAPGSSLAQPEDRVRHIVELKPEICSIDVGTFNHGEAVFMNTPGHLRRMAELIRDAGVTPEIEAFEVGHLLYGLHLVETGLVTRKPYFQMCLGLRWALPARPETILQLRALLPDGANWVAFGISRWQFPMAACSVLMGGHVRVGLEDSIYIERGVLAEGNAPLVRRAVELIRQLGERPATTDEARRILELS